jgi:hypothetical protein
LGEGGVGAGMLPIPLPNLLELADAATPRAGVEARAVSVTRLVDPVPWLSLKRKRREGALVDRIV